MQNNKKMYKYISVVSFVIVVTLIINLMFPALSKAEGNYIKAQPNDDSTVKIQVVIDNIYKEVSKLYIIKADEISIPKTEEELIKFETDYTANSIIEYLNNTNNEFIKPIEEPGKYYAVVLLKKRAQNNSDDEIYVTAMSATYTFIANKEGKKQQDNDKKTDDIKIDNNQTDNSKGLNEEKLDNRDESNKDNTEGNKATEIVEDVMQIKVNSNKEQSLNIDEYEELIDANDKKEENKNIEEKENKDKSIIKPEDVDNNKNIEQKNNKNENEKNDIDERKEDNNNEKIVSKRIIVPTTIIEKEENKSKLNLPQTGEDNTGLIIAITIFSIIGLTSFAKYKSMK